MDPGAPSTIRRRTPCAEARSSSTLAQSTVSPRATTAASSPSRSRARNAPASVVYTTLSPPVVQNGSPASRSPEAVTATFSGYGGSPAATRSARRCADLTRSRGRSARRVPAPTRIASHDARTASTRSKSSALDRNRRSGPASSRQPSRDTAADSRTYGRDGWDMAAPGPGGESCAASTFEHYPGATATERVVTAGAVDA